MKKIFTLIATALVATGVYADESWEFSSLLDQSSITETTELDGLTIYATSDKSVTIDENSKTFDETSYTVRLKLGGTGGFSDGEPVSRILAFDVTGDCDITVHCLSASGSSERELYVDAGEKDNQIGDIPAHGAISDYTSSEATISYSGDATTIYMYSASSGINIYGIYVTYASSGESDGIATIAASADGDSAAYNLAGQKVSSSYKGVVVQGGKKILQK